MALFFSTHECNTIFRHLHSHASISEEDPDDYVSEASFLDQSSSIPRQGQFMTTFSEDNIPLSASIPKLTMAVLTASTSESHLSPVRDWSSMHDSDIALLAMCMQNLFQRAQSVSEKRVHWNGSFFFCFQGLRFCDRRFVQCITTRRLWTYPPKFLGDIRKSTTGKTSSDIRFLW